jgi:hypothetical protein
LRLDLRLAAWHAGVIQGFGSSPRPFIVPSIAGVAGFLEEAGRRQPPFFM